MSAEAYPDAYNIPLQLPTVPWRGTGLRAEQGCSTDKAERARLKFIETQMVIDAIAGEQNVPAAT
jgi:hypothetical protein